MATARELLDLKVGTRLKVTLRSGRQVEARLTGNPWLAASGAPGLGRVQLLVVDIDHEARITKYWEGLSAERMGMRTTIGVYAKAKHTINGKQVLEVLP